LAFVEIGQHIDVSLNTIKVLRKIGMDIVALFRSPCPKLLLNAIKSGRIQGLYKIPVNIKSFQMHVNKFVSKNINTVHGYGQCLLTREEVNFILSISHEDA